MQNLVVLSGFVKKAPIRKTSPNGILHCQFYLEHYSTQIEANCSRKVWCIMPVIVSGLAELSESIVKGSKMEVTGFISLHNKSNNIQQIVLHASEIKFIN